MLKSLLPQALQLLIFKPKKKPRSKIEPNAVPRNTNSGRRIVLAAIKDSE
jgi:hypothetical protein